MKIILLKNILKLGKLGDIIKVKNGYARNFLIPKKEACLATKKKILKFKKKYFNFLFFFKKKKKKEKIIFNKLNNLNIFFYKKINNFGIIYNKINKFDIIKKLEKKNIFLKNKQIKLNYNNNINKIGRYNIKIILNNNKKIILYLNILKK